MRAALVASMLVGAVAMSSVRFVHKATGHSRRISYDGGDLLHVPGYATAAALNATHQSVLALQSELAAFKTHEAGEKASIRAEIAALGSTLATKSSALNITHNEHVLAARAARDKIAADALAARATLVSQRATAVESLQKADEALRVNLQQESEVRAFALSKVENTTKVVAAALNQSHRVLAFEDTVLHARIDNEAGQRQDGDHQDRQLVLSAMSQLRNETNQLVDAEVEMRKAADVALYGQVQNDTQQAIDAEALARASAIAAEAGLRRAADGLLRDSLRANVSAADNAARAYATAAREKEAELRAAQDQLLADAISDEQLARLNNVSQLVSDMQLRAAEHGAALDERAQNITAALAVERQARTAAVAQAITLLEQKDTQLHGTLTQETQQKINSEAQARTVADEKADAARQALAYLISNETYDRQEAVQEARDHADGAVDGEKDLRLQEAAVLRAAIAGEVATRNSTDWLLQAYITGEVQARQAAVAQLGVQRQQVVQQLQQARNAAVQQLEAADEAIRNDTSSLEAARVAAVAAITTARNNAVDELQRVDNDIRASVDTVESDLSAQVAAEKAFKARLVFDDVGTTAAPASASV